MQVFHELWTIMKEIMRRIMKSNNTLQVPHMMIFTKVFVTNNVVINEINEPKQMQRLMLVHTRGRQLVGNPG